MRTTLTLSGLAVGVLVVGCGKSPSHTANADLQRDLKLASTANLALATQSQTTKYALVENTPQAKPNEGRALHKAAGPKALPSATPTVKAAPEPALAPVLALPQLQMIPTAAAPVPSIAPVPAAVPTEDLPAPVPGRATGTEDGTGATGGMYPGAGTGAVIRGMGPDGDNCGPPRPGGGVLGIPMFFPPMAGPAGAGGAGGAARPSTPSAPRARGGGGGL